MDHQSQRTIRLTIQYDGTGYVGWQVQPNGISIQQVLEEALARMLQEPVRLMSSGRTDAGVHARGMVAAFTTTRSIPLRAFSDGLNSLLPPDIAVQEAREAPAGFNPRFEAIGKHYRYTLCNAPRRSPLNRLYAWHLRAHLDLAAMVRAAALFVGEHDFASFRTAGCAAKTTVRRMDSFAVYRHGSCIIFDVKGSGFLRNMVRLMVGTLVEVGRGRMTPEDVALCLAEPGREAGPTAPARGLCLEEVYYEPGEEMGRGLTLMNADTGV
jgi:tRNA pseudouridine38-40 synthase